MRRGVSSKSRATPNQARAAARKARIKVARGAVSLTVIAERQEIVDGFRAAPPVPTWFYQSQTNWRYGY